MRLPRIGPERAVRVVRKLGFNLVRSTGSHRVYRHPDGRLCVIPYHAGQTLSPRMIRSILRDTRLTLDQFVELL